MQGFDHMKMPFIHANIYNDQKTQFYIHEFCYMDIDSYKHFSLDAIQTSLLGALPGCSLSLETWWVIEQSLRYVILMCIM